MVPAFGFSVGDFISAIGLTVKISKALRETGGASAECRMVVQDLQKLQQVLELLKDLRPAAGSLSHVNAIKGIALTCLIPLREFSEKIDRKYGSIATASSSDHFLRRGGKKAQWVVFATEEVAKFRTILAAKIASIGLLLGVFNSESLSRIEDQNRESRSYLLAKSQEHRDSLETNLSRLAISNHRSLSKEIHEARDNLKDEIKRFEARTESRRDVLFTEASKHTNKLDSLNDRIGQVQKDAYSNTKVLVGLCFGTAAGAEHILRALRRDSRNIGDQMKSIREEQSHMGVQMVEKFQAVSHQAKMIRLIGTSILRCLLPFSEKVLQYLRENMKANMEIYALLLRIQSGMPKQLDNGDKFLFEDVLGRSKSLPYEYFRHWEVFESMLRCEFRGLPGEEKVQRGQYILLNGTHGRNQIIRERWQQVVFPGTLIRMSVVMHKLGVNDGTQDGIFYQCPICQLVYAVQQLLPTDHHDDTSWQRITLGKDREPSKALPTQNMVRHEQKSAGERRSERVPTHRARIEKESQEFMAFRSIHLLGSDALSLQNQLILNYIKEEGQKLLHVNEPIGD